MGDSSDDAVFGTKQSTTAVVTVTDSDKEIVAEPKYVSMDDRTTLVILPDEEGQHHVVTGIGWSVKTGPCNFYLHGGDGTRKGPHVYATANSGDFMLVRLRFGPGDPVKANITITPGAELSLYVEYHTVPIATTQPTTQEYADA
jgi:hypothetical protein